MEITGSIGIIAHPFKPEAIAFEQKLVRWLEAVCGRAVHIILQKEEIARGDALLIVLGGDGFFMRVARELQRKKIATPVLGVNLGNVGFLTLADEGNAREMILAALRGDLEVERRYALRIKVGKKTFVAINDMYVRPRAGMLVAAVDVIRKNRASLFKAIRLDTLIFWTPMGSAAYNDSADGPISDPTGDYYGMTGLAAQSRKARVKFIFPRKAKVTITVLGVRPPTRNGEPMDPESLPLQIDGDICIDDLAIGTVIEIELFKSCVRYLGDGWQAFAKALHDKAEVSQ